MFDLAQGLLPTPAWRPQSHLPTRRPCPHSALASGDCLFFSSEVSVCAESFLFPLWPCRGSSLITACTYPAHILPRARFFLNLILVQVRMFFIFQGMFFWDLCVYIKHVLCGQSGSVHHWLELSVGMSASFRNCELLRGISLCLPESGIRLGMRQSWGTVCTYLLLHVSEYFHFYFICETQWGSSTGSVLKCLLI